MSDLIVPVQKNEALLADIRGVKPSASTCSVWWLGQSGFLVGYNDHFLLFDPYLSDSLTCKYLQTDKPHTRLTELVIAPQKLDFLDVVTSSHNHTDHLDDQTLKPLFEVNSNLQFVLPRANLAFASERLAMNGDNWIGLNEGENATVGCWEFYGIASAHNELQTDENGCHKFMGLVVKFGPFCVYHSGDCLPYDGFEARLQPFDIDLALLPINGNLPKRHVAGNFDGVQAAQLAKNVGAKTVVPCHFEMFSFNTASPDEFKAHCQEIGQKFRVLRCGERLDLKPQ